MEKREYPKKPQGLERIIKTILYILLLILGGYALFFSANRFTGFSINSSTAVVSGSFLGVVLFFFIIVLILLKLKAKPYKSPKTP